MTAATLPAPTAILFDIDGTLIVNGNSHFPSLAHGLQEVLGVPLPWHRIGDRLFLSGQEISGWVDWQLFEAAAAQSNITLTRPQFEAVAAAAAAHMPTLPGYPSWQPAPGAHRALLSLAATAIPLALSTGNAIATAHLKTDSVDLARHFTFHPDGGFGHHPDRTAVAAAAAHHVGAAGERVWLVGDTVADMRAAQANGFTPIGVSFGAATPDALRAAGAAAILDDLRDLITLRDLS